jgi:two-component system, NtrC family, nitrogen regulation sensor histidine kinase NtrY
VSRRPFAVGRFERRIVLAIVVAASLPLAGALVFGRQALREAYTVGVNPRVGTELTDSLGSYRARLVALRDGAEDAARAIAADHALNDLIESHAEGPELADRLRVLLDRHPSATVIAIPSLGARVERAPSDDVRSLTLSEPLASGAALEVTLTTPAAPFRAYLRAGETAAVYRRLDAATNYVSSFFLLLYVTLVLSSIVVAITVSTLMARRITRRVVRLAEATERVGRGDLSIALPIEGDDEVAELTHAFNAMVRDVRGSRDRIDYLERVGAWQEMARRLAHEIKNPLTPIQLAMQEVHGAYRGDDPKFARKLDDAKEMVEEEIRTLRRLVHDFSEFARLPTPTLAPTDLGEFVRELGRALDPDKLRAEGAPKTPSPELKIEVPERELPVAIDAPMMRRALDNLVRNAVHAIDGHVGEAEGEWRRGHVWLRARLDRGWASLEVEDDGPGIPPSERERVFSPYVTTKPDGTGLGLAIVKKLVLEHGGSIVCTEGGSGGALFVIRLPIRRPGPKEAR